MHCRIKPTANSQPRLVPPSLPPSHPRPPPCSLLGLLAFTAPYLPWALLGFSLLLGHDITSDVLGIAVGHVYYFAADVYPALAAARGWRCRRVMRTPWIL